MGTEVINIIKTNPLIDAKLELAFPFPDNPAENLNAIGKNLAKKSYNVFKDKISAKLQNIDENKVDETIHTLQQYKSHLVSYWNELGDSVAESDNKFDKAHNYAGNIMLRYKEKLTENGVDSDVSNKLLGIVTAMSVKPIMEVRENLIPDLPFDKGDMIVPYTTLTQQKEYLASKPPKETPERF